MARPRWETSKRGAATQATGVARSPTPAHTVPGTVPTAASTSIAMRAGVRPTASASVAATTEERINPKGDWAV